ncbi:heparan-alpha-glucosaminide N-acetyltransferase domain-containing protein [Paenarthrobacter ilicis]|uniref:Membrane protein n=1 Tax=Paenarthrobacter ilicis TaxID=43665 RepID=A0ABX0TGC3_9MICC|nr:heparan-alpha-glucosaminide N-acetyltransferase domain-containing protein [Paenarthrobacter ilicis]MBM7792791.1 putative membrane protein [Paenarthrobacter ilicis]NIJ01134.1 putative membrane protein [Paenarthrobacter ilicis]
MTSHETARHGDPSPAAAASPRLIGIDAARGAALLGMMATHLMPTFGPPPAWDPTFVGLVFSGRSAALFAVLAGIGLALSTGKQEPRTGAALWAARRGVAARALVIAVVGFMLGGLDVNIAVILVHYAFLFLCVLPFLGMRLRALCWWALAWVLASPLAAFLIRPVLLDANPPLRLGHNPGTDDFETPGRLLGDIFITGYYPVIQWLSYVLVGLVVGRLALTSTKIQVLLVACGVVTAVLSKIMGFVAMELWGGREALEALPVTRGYPLQSMLQVNLTGLQQTDSWWWLATASPHAGSTLDLLHTSGTASAVVGSMLLLAGAVQRAGANILLILSGPGSMTLTLYSAHVWVVSGFTNQPLPVGWTPEGMYWAQALCAVGIGVCFGLLGRRGPLEWVAHQASRLARYRPAVVG